MVLEDVVKIIAFLKNWERTHIKLSSVFDVGAGRGSFGKEFRKTFPHASLDGAEPYPKLFNFLLRKEANNGEPLYSALWPNKIEDIFIKKADYDFIVALEVLERMEKDEGEAFLNRFKGKLLLSTVIQKLPSKDSDNPFDKIKHIWEHQELMLRAKKCLHRGRISGVYLF